jgi:hypothetical protein
MAFSTQDSDEVLSEINVTPLVDVMLVLLVVFIVTAPLLTNAIPARANCFSIRTRSSRSSSGCACKAPRPVTRKCACSCRPTMGSITE